VKRPHLDLRQIAWAAAFGVLMFVISALMSRYVWGDGFDWGTAAFVAVPTAVFAAVTGALPPPRSRRSGSGVS
jgi:hypothetical protein